MTAEEIVSLIERKDWVYLAKEELLPLVASWRERGEALKAIEETLAEIDIGNLNASLVHLRALARVRGPDPEDVV